MSDEPRDGSYVLVRFHEPPGAKPGVYRREDRAAFANELGDKHWFSRTDLLERAKSWTELTELGDIADVGAFLDRSGKEAT